ncbi:MAG: Smr/MutS family protein [Alphaproteobacteria bacterium]
MASRRRRRVSKGESALFRTAMRDVVPLRRAEDQTSMSDLMGEGKTSTATASAPPAPPAQERRVTKPAQPQHQHPDLSRLDAYRPDLAPAEKVMRRQALAGKPAKPAPSHAPSSGDHPLQPGRHAQIDGLDGRTWGRLKRGRLPIEARIDLHGLSQHEAHAALQGFVLQAQARGDRTVLVITGKGTPRKSSDRPRTGAIRSAMPHWLAQSPLNRIVITYTEAQPRDGGSGAFYLRLRRLR